MTHGDTEEAQDMIDRIQDWAENKSWFDARFVDDVQEQLLEKGFITETQVDALWNIIKEFDID
ncbi:MAG: hypothetical protein ACE5H1_04840 [Thermodesulfobacteriota bacterium]